MTEKQKELLFKDICCRLPYGVKAYVRHYSKLDRKWYEGIYTIESACPCLNDIFVCSERGSVEVIVGYDDYEIKPYLLPMSSMTEEQKEEYNRWKHIIPVCHYEYGDVVEEDELWDSPWSYQYLIENHFDCNGLIPMGLAEDATGLSIY